MLGGGGALALGVWLVLGEGFVLEFMSDLLNLIHR